jgi:hypothetical protein
MTTSFDIIINLDLQTTNEERFFQLTRVPYIVLEDSMSSSIRREFCEGYLESKPDEQAIVARICSKIIKNEYNVNNVAMKQLGLKNSQPLNNINYWTRLQFGTRLVLPCG